MKNILSSVSILLTLISQDAFALDACAHIDVDDSPSDRSNICTIACTDAWNMQ